jgi:hypothetical protein
MKRVLIAITLILLLSLVIAADTSDTATTDKVEKAYTCLQNKVKTDCSGAITTEDQAFSLLALSYESSIQGKCLSSLESGKQTKDCWSSKKSDSACTLKNTALAILAMQRINQDTEDAEAWLANQTMNPSELSWYLEIDSKDPALCSIKYSNSSVKYEIKMAEDKKLTITKTASDSCLSIENGYWLKINCLDKNYQVSCDKDFISALLYKKSGTNSDVWYVSSQTKSASASGSTENQVNSLCFKQNNKCDYEGSLWATLGLSKNNNIDKYLPYLIALSQDNEALNPYSFLYILSSSDDYLSSIRTSQAQAGYWGNAPGSVYTTSISLLALNSLNDENSGRAKDWLLSTQGTDGCWNNLKDTAFALYSGWPKEPSISNHDTYCDDNEKCISRTDCSEISGDVLDRFDCIDTGKICCSKAPIKKSCSEQSGIICKSDETCSGDSATASDTSDCCLGTCEIAPQQTACEEAGYSCSSSCSSDEEETSDACDSSSVCCKASTPSPTTSYWWVWLLAILIILAILGIVFKDRLKMIFFKLKGGSSSPVRPTRPGFPPTSSMQPRPMFRQMPMQRPQPQVTKPIQKSNADKELDETLRKLREMSK